MAPCSNSVHRTLTLTLTPSMLSPNSHGYLKPAMTQCSFNWHPNYQTLNLRWEYWLSDGTLWMKDDALSDINFIRPPFFDTLFSQVSHTILLMHMLRSCFVQCFNTVLSRRIRKKIKKLPLAACFIVKACIVIRWQWTILCKCQSVIQIQRQTQDNNWTLVVIVFFVIIYSTLMLMESQVKFLIVHEIRSKWGLLLTWNGSIQLETWNWFKKTLFIPCPKWVHKLDHASNPFAISVLQETWITLLELCGATLCHFPAVYFYISKQVPLYFSCFGKCCNPVLLWSFKNVNAMTLHLTFHLHARQDDLSFSFWGELVL